MEWVRRNCTNLSRVSNYQWWNEAVLIVFKFTTEDFKFIVHGSSFGTKKVSAVIKHTFCAHILFLSLSDAL